GKAEFHRCSRSGIAGLTSPHRQANPPADINADQPRTPLAATIDNEGLADAAAARPFRLPRLHPGIGSSSGAADRLIGIYGGTFRTAASRYPGPDFRLPFMERIRPAKPPDSLSAPWPNHLRRQAPFFLPCHSRATSGLRTAREVCGLARVRAHTGHPLPSTRAVMTADDSRPDMAGSHPGAPPHAPLASRFDGIRSEVAVVLGVPLLNELRMSNPPMSARGCPRVRGLRLRARWPQDACDVRRH